MSKKRKHKKISHHNIFDNVFHTIATKMPQLIIPIVNLLYGLNIPPGAPIIQLRNEFYERNGKFITDSLILILR